MSFSGMMVAPPVCWIRDFVSLSLSTSCQARQNVDFAPSRNRLEPSVAINPPVDRDRDAALQLRLQRGVSIAQTRQQLPDIGSLDLDPGLAARCGFERSPEDDSNHQLLRP